MYSTIYVEIGSFLHIFIIFDIKSVEKGVVLVLCALVSQILELRNSFVLERLPVKFSIKLEQDHDFRFFITVLTTGEAIWTKSKNHMKICKNKNFINSIFSVQSIIFRLIRISRETHSSKIYSTLSVESGLFCIHNYWRQKYRAGGWFNFMRYTYAYS